MPPSSGKVERANSLIKQQLTKLFLKLRSSSSSFLPTALTSEPLHTLLQDLVLSSSFTSRWKPFLHNHHHNQLRRPHWSATSPTSLFYGLTSVHMLRATYLTPHLTQLLPNPLLSPQGTKYSSVISKVSRALVERTLHSDSHHAFSFQSPKISVLVPPL